MIKAILFDGDGVSLLKKEYFSDRYAREYNVPIEKIMPFFRNEFKLCQLGKADIKEELAKYLFLWGWEKSVDDFLQYWFIGDTLPNETVIDKIQKIRDSGVKCYLVTDQEKYRAEYIRKELGFNEKFDKCFFSFEIGHLKAEPEFFTAMLEEINLKPERALCFDDDGKNLAIAARLGIRTKLYKRAEDID